jgi:hypothetical protein
MADALRAAVSVDKDISTVFNEAKSLGLLTVLMTEATGTPLAKSADVVIVIPRGRTGSMALHGGDARRYRSPRPVAAAAKPSDALTSLDRLNELRRAISGQSRTQV